MFFRLPGDDGKRKQAHPAGLGGCWDEVFEFVDGASWCAGCCFVRQDLQDLQDFAGYAGSLSFAV